jgi:hypothetical protein
MSIIGLSALQSFFAPYHSEQFSISIDILKRSYHLTLQAEHLPVIVEHLAKLRVICAS